MLNSGMAQDVPLLRGFIVPSISFFSGSRLKS